MFVEFNNFSYYLTGLIEGDGSIIVPRQIRDAKGRKKYPSIQIVFNAKDFPLALIIQKILKHCILQKKKNVNAYVLFINNLDGISLLVHLLNGKMRTPKIFLLYRLIE